MTTTTAHTTTKVVSVERLKEGSWEVLATLLVDGKERIELLNVYNDLERFTPEKVWRNDPPSIKDIRDAAVMFYIAWDADAVRQLSNQERNQRLDSEQKRLDNARAFTQPSKRHQFSDEPKGEHPLTGCTTQEQAEAARRREIEQLGRPMFTCRDAGAPKNPLRILGEPLPGETAHQYRDRIERELKIEAMSKLFPESVTAAPSPRVRFSPPNDKGVRQVYKGKSLVGAIIKKPEGEWWVAPWAFDRLGGVGREYFDRMNEIRDYVAEHVHIHH